MAQDVARRPSARERILGTAGNLFYAEGIHAVGVERVVGEAGVTKATLYQHFRSKDQLVAACLKSRSEEWRRNFAEPVLAMEGSPARRVSAVFDLLVKALGAPDFRGCPFINAAAEYPGPEGPVAEAIAAHRVQVRALFFELVAERGRTRRAELAEQLVLLFDGAMVGAHLGGGLQSARRARSAAMRLVEERAF